MSPAWYSDMCTGAHFRGFVDPECIAVDDPQPSLRRLGHFGESGEAARVALDGDDLRAGAKQRAGEASGTRSDFVDALPRKVARNAGDAVEQLLVEEEVLAERLGRAEAVARDHLPQWGERLHPPATRRAQSAAMRSAAIIASGLARPRPAMSKAVP